MELSSEIAIQLEKGDFNLLCAQAEERGVTVEELALNLLAEHLSNNDQPQNLA